MPLIEVRGRGLGAALVVLSLSLGGRALAQSDEQRAAARSLATEGAAAFNEGRYQEAVDLFGKAESLVHAPPHLLFLARSHAKLNQLVKAREAYMKIVKETLPPNASPAFRNAQDSANEELRTIEPRIASLTVKVEGGKDAKDLAILVDGTPINMVLVGVSQPIDPGEHKIEAGATGLRAPTQTVTLSDGERKSIVLTLEPAPGAAPLVAVAQPAATPAPAQNQPAPAASPAPVDAAPAPADDKSGLRTGSYIAFGVGVVGLAAGTFFTLQSSSKRKDADAKFEECGGESGCRTGNPLSEEVADLDDEARSAMTLGIVGFAVGGVGIATGATLLLLSSGGADERQAGVTPYVGFGVAGLKGRF
ncbi:MAG TPA: tetratricopeptide repeat protein [Polyangiaceae bacterium]